MKYEINQISMASFLPIQNLFLQNLMPYAISHKPVYKLLCCPDGLKASSPMKNPNPVVTETNTLLR